MVAKPETPGTDSIQVCTLPPAGLRERLAWIRQEILPHVRRSERLESGVAWDLAAAPGLAEKLDRLIALERECCAGIHYTRVESSDPRSLRLEIQGVDPDGFLRTLAPPATSGRQGLRRLAKAGGLGVSLSLLACCLTPLVATALVGAAVAAPLAALDQPLPIIAGALIATGVAWRWLGGRDRTRTERSR